MFENKSQKVLPRARFFRRLAIFYAAAGGLILMALLAGIAGYHWLAGYGFLDSLLNAAMVLGGMGQIDALRTPEAKWFASAFALFSGLVFVTVTGLILAPILHRVLHLFHVEDRR